jgi:hypothetical protein
MPVEAISLIDEPPFDKLSLALVGKEKSGKSLLAGTARAPVLFFDFDQRREGLKILPKEILKNIYVLAFTDPTWPNMPTSYSQALDYVSIVERGGTLKDLGFGVEQRPKTAVIDSIQTFAKSVMSFSLYNNKEIRRSINVAGKMELQVPYGFDGWNAEMQGVEGVVLRLLAVKGLDVIIILHETPEEAPESTDKNPVYTGRIEVFPVRHKRLLKNFNEVWRVTREIGKIPAIQTTADYKYTAASCLDLNDLGNPPNIAMALAKYNTQPRLPEVSGK